MSRAPPSHSEKDVTVAERLPRDTTWEWGNSPITQEEKMKSCQARSLVKSVIIVLTLSFTGFVFLPSDTRAQTRASTDPIANFRALPRASHLTCPDCFTIVGQDRYEIFE